VSSGEIVVNLLFYVFAIVAIGGAVAVAASQNIVRSAFSLLAVLFSAAAFYAFMRADFVFAAQVLIYVGGILVLIIFAIMLTHRITDVQVSNESSHGPASMFACLCVLFSLVVVIATYKWTRSERPVDVTVPGTKATVSLGMLQADAQYAADRGTGVPRDGMLIDGRGWLVVRAPDLPAGVVAARFHVEGGTPVKEKESATKAWTWKTQPLRGADHADVVFDERRGVGREARLELTGLPAGRYRWGVSLVSEKSDVKPTEIARFGAAGAGEASDFRVEAGLSRPIGMALMGPYLLPFEVVSVLLLAALIGAAFLARKEVKEQR